MSLYIRASGNVTGGSSGGGGGGTPGGTTGELQYNSAGVFGGDTSTTDGSGNISATTYLASGTITGSQLISNVAIGTAPLNVTSTTLVPNLHVANSATSTVTAKADNTNYFLPLINGSTSGEYGLDVGANLNFNPNTNQLAVGLGGSVSAFNMYTVGLVLQGVGSVTVQQTSGGGTTYNFNLPETAGTTGQLLTSAGGIGGTPMTWTDPATIVPSQASITAVSTNASFYPVFVSGNTTGNYGLDVISSSGFTINPSSGLVSATALQASSQIQTPQLIMTGPIDILGSGSGDISIKAQAAAGTYNFNLPQTAGTSGYLLTSAGGGTSPMTYTDPASFQPSGNYITALTGGVTASGPGSATATVVTNANLTGPITSVGNATVIASQTGTGTKFVVDNTPTLITPVLGAATGTSLNLGGGGVGTPSLFLATDTTTGLYRPGVNQLNIGVSGAAVANFGTSGLAVTGALSATTTVTATTQLISSVATGTAPLVVASTTQVANLNAATAGSAGTATTATNLAGGAGGSIPYQSAASTTAMLANGSAGQVVTSAGTTLAPVWSTPNPATNVTTTQVSSNASYFPLMAASSTNSNQAVDLGTGLTFNPSTNIMSTTGLNLSGLSASQAVVTDGSKNLASLAYATAPAASTLAEWDANKNLSANNLIDGFRTQATVNSTLALVIGDAGQQYFTGTTAGQIVTLPTTSVVAGVSYILVNNSTQSITVQSSGANTVQVMAASTQGVFTALVATPTTAANWSVTYTPTSNSTLAVQPTVTKYTTGSGNYTTPAGVQTIRVRMVASGGSGSGSATSGWVAANDGNDTTFGLHTASKGLKGGAGNTGGAPGAGGSGTIGAGGIGSVIVGDGGGSGDAVITGVVIGGHGGGGGIFGGGANGQAGGNNGSAGVTNTGGGGGGAGLGSGAGGNGGGGGGALDILINPTSGQVFAYSVGASASGGSAGSGGNTGGASGSGLIEITEYYFNLGVTSTIAAVSPTQQKFTTGTAQTYTTPAGVQWIKVTCVGGGGGGGEYGSGAASGGAGGGGGGGTAITWINAPSATYTYSVGGAGNGGSGGSGSAGGNTSFGSSLCTANGGAAGANADSAVSGAAGGAGGTVSFGSIQIPGQSGAGGDNTIATVVYASGGAGGSSTLGAGGAGANQMKSPNTAGTVGGVYGGGGQGGAGASGAGANGAAGVIIVEEFYTNLAVGTSAAITANYVMAGPTSGAAAAPTFRALVNADMPTIRSQVIVNGSTGWGGTNTKIKRFTSSSITGTDITYAASSSLGDTFTIATAGLYSISGNDAASGAAAQNGASINSAQLTTNIASITTANRIAYNNSVTGDDACFSVTIICSANDVIRCHGDGTGNSSQAQMTITKVGN